MTFFFRFFPRAKVEAHFLKKLAIATKNVRHKVPSENFQGQQKIFQNTQQYANSYAQIFLSRIQYNLQLTDTLKGGQL